MNSLNVGNEISNKSNDKEFETRVSVGVLTYNQEDYILECLNSIIRQKGNFRMKLIICDDNSQDNTLKIIKDFIKNSDINSQIQTELISNQENIGVTANFYKCIDNCRDSDFFTICEGDDYWTDDYRIAKHIDFLCKNPNCSYSFNAISIFYQKDNDITDYKLQTELKGNCFSIVDLIKKYFIGNLSCCFYNSEHLTKIDGNLFKNPVFDWFFNINYARFGNIGFINEKLSVYRIHEKSYWSAMNTLSRNRILFDLIHIYNELTNFDYDEHFSNHHQYLFLQEGIFDNKETDLLIIDDVFPHILSPFRYQEFLSYLENIKNTYIFTNGISLGVLGNETITDTIIKFKKKYPHFKDKIYRYSSGIKNIKPKLIYYVFLNNVIRYLDHIDAMKVPFVFELYPGGGFAFDNPEIDFILKKVFSNNYFRKVIVTQRPVYNYLVSKELCKPNQIEMIFGVVTPIEKLQKSYKKSFYGIDKENLDIVFVAHKYTDKGIDKGYDIFIDTAIEMCREYENIYWHVVGNFNDTDIDVSMISSKIKFYGTLDQDQFDTFFENKDIILSPNIPDKIYKGSFDGFPTASCTDAGLRRTAIFCTDELNMNHQNAYFTDGREIVIIKHDLDDIIAKIKYYYNNPIKLKDIADYGSMKIKELYSFENQIKPRIEILNKEITNYSYNIRKSKNQKELFRSKIMYEINFLRKNLRFNLLHYLLMKSVSKVVINTVIILSKSLSDDIKSKVRRIIPAKIINYIDSRFFNK